MLDARPFSVSDLWTPSCALPGRDVLTLIAARLAKAWGLSHLAKTVTICYNPRLRTTLGRAVYDDFRVELNARLLLEHPAELVPTLAHELAHLAVYVKWRSAQPHGQHFRMMMASVGMPASATHNLPTAHLRKRRRRYLYIHQCGQCGQSHVARSVMRNRVCAACGSGTWDVFRIPDTVVGRKIVAQLRSRQRRLSARSGQK